MERKIKFNKSIFSDFLSRHDLLYTVAPDKWEKGIPMGNSKVSAVVWGHDNLKVTINRADIWEMRRYQPDRDKFNWKTFTTRIKNGDEDMSGIFQTNKDKGPIPQQLPLGRFEAILKGKKWLDYNMRLHLHDAVITGHINTEIGSIFFDCHVSAKQPLIVFNYETHGQEEVKFNFRFSSKLDEFKQDEVISTYPFRLKGLTRGYDRKNLPDVSHILKDWGYEQPTFFEKEGISVYKQNIPENGNYSVAWTTISYSNNKKTLIVAITTDDINGKAEDEAVNIVSQYVVDKALDIELEEHKNWWHNFYPSSFYSMNDTKLEALYWINTYKLGCVSRIDGQATPMSGLWIPDNTLPPWGNTYIWNTQQQMPFFGTYVGNRLDTQLSTYQLLFDHRDEMKKIGEEYFGVKDGEYLVHLTDYKLGCPNYTKDHMQAVCGPWMMQMMWNYYKFSMDESILRDHLFSMMKAQMRVLISMLEKGEDGKLHYNYTMSAEYPAPGGHLGTKCNRFGPDATSDLSYTIWMAQTLLEIEGILGIKDPEEDNWKYVLNNIAPFTYDEFGALRVRADMPLQDSHRHLSHLFPITQTHQITPDTEEGKKIIQACMHSLKVAGTGEWMGWTFTETAKIAQMLGEAPLAYYMIHQYSDWIVNENTLDFNSSRDGCLFTYQMGLGMTIDSDGMYNEALQNFAVTSYNDKVWFFNSVPKELKDISFYHFRTEGAFLVSGSRKNGINEFITVEPQFGGKFNFISPFENEISIICDGISVDYSVINGVVSFETEKDKEYIITAKGKEIDEAIINSIVPKEHELNCYGCKI